MRSALAFFVAVYAVQLCAGADGRGAAYARAITEAGLDPEACYRVRDLAFQKEDLRFYLTDGHLIFSKPVEGRRFAAVFTADTPGGDGEVIVFPPNRSERLSLASFAKTPNLNEHFYAALFLFTDDTADQLLADIESGRGQKAAEMGTALAQSHSPTLRNLAQSYEIRLVYDHLSAATRQGGLFYATINGRQLGAFDVLYDPRVRDGILLGQLVFRNDRRYFDTWTTFPARSVRTGQRSLPSAGNKLRAVKIDATLGPDLSMRAITRLTMAGGEGADSAVLLDLSRRMRITEARLDGEPVEVFARESLRANLLRSGENDLFLVVLPKPFGPGETHTLEIAHEGNVVTAAGNGVYFVGSRTSWYPNRNAEFAPYDITFRHPRTLNLVATGDLVSEKTEGETRVVRHQASVPIRFAGFNLGQYEKITSNRAGVTLEVCANRRVEAALEERPREILIQPASPFPSRSGRARSEIMTLPLPVRTPNSTSRLQDLTGEIASALDYMAAHFGPPPLKTLTVSPIPGGFGQGFPGLLYLSTLAYLNPADRPAAWQSEYQRTFFSELLHAHETAHQWWGNLVASASYRDDWLMEALASYSALLVLENKKGRRALDAVLDEYRTNLLREIEGGRTVESAGPITLGVRLISSQNPNAWRVILYEKGSWIMHMLRVRLGDASFLRMLGELAKRKRFQSVSTEEWQQLAAEFLPRGSDDPKLEMFFDQWVYGTGIPTLKMSHSVSGKAPKVRLRGTIVQSDASEDSSLTVPVEVQLPGRRSVVRWIRTTGPETPFSIELQQSPVRVTLNPNNAVLARR